MPDVIPVDDRGLNYGDGLFETLRVESGRIPLLGRHLLRLAAGCRQIGLAWPGHDELDAQLMAAALAMGNGILKCILTRGSGGRGYAPPPGPVVRTVITRHDLPDYPRDNYRRGVAARLCRTRLGCSPDTAGLKHLGRLEQVLASMEPAEDTLEGLMNDSDGHIVGGIRSNLFLVTSDAVVTPDVTRAGVAGVMRAEVLDATARSGMPTEIRDVMPEELAEVEEAFLTNSVFGIWPIREVLRLCAFDAPGPVTSRLMSEIAGLGVAAWAP